MASRIKNNFRLFGPCSIEDNRRQPVRNLRKVPLRPIGEVTHSRSGLIRWLVCRIVSDGTAMRMLLRAGERIWCEPTSRLTSGWLPCNLTLTQEFVLFRGGEYYSPGGPPSFSGYQQAATRASPPRKGPHCSVTSGGRCATLAGRPSRRSALGLQSAGQQVIAHAVSGHITVTSAFKAAKMYGRMFPTTLSAQPVVACRSAGRELYVSNRNDRQLAVIPLKCINKTSSLAARNLCGHCSAHVCMNTFGSSSADLFGNNKRYSL